MLLIDKLSIETLFFAVFFRSKHKIVYIRVTYIAKNILKYLPYSINNRISQHNESIVDTLYNTSKNICRKNFCNHVEILNRIMNLQKIRCDELSSIIGVKNEKISHQIRETAWVSYYNLAESIALFRILDAEKLILTDRSSNKFISKFTDDYYFVRRWIDYSPIVCRKDMHEDMAYEQTYKTLKTVLTLYFVFLYIKIRSVFFRKKVVENTKNPLRVGIWVVGMLDENVLDETTWMNGSAFQSSSILFVNRKQNNTQLLKKYNIVYTDYRSIVRQLLERSSDNFGYFSRNLKDALMLTLHVVFRIDESLKIKLFILNVLLTGVWESSILKMNNISILYGKKVTGAPVIAADRCGIVYVTGTWSVNPRHHSIYSTAADVVFVWSKMIMNNYILSGAKPKCFVMAGIPAIKLRNYAKNYAEKFLSRYETNNKIVIGFLDDKPENSFVSKKLMHCSYKLILSIVEDNHRLFLVIKPRDINFLKESYPQEYKRISSLISNGRAAFLYENFPKRPISLILGFICDIVIAGSSINSAAVEASSTGSAVVHIHLMQGTSAQHDMVKDGYNKYVFFDVESAKIAILNLINCKDYNVGHIKDWKTIIGPNKSIHKALRLQYITYLNQCVLKFGMGNVEKSITCANEIFSQSFDDCLVYDDY